MATSPLEWRRLWRRRGLAVDRTLPKFFCHPAPALKELASLVPTNVVLPGGQKQRVTEDDSVIVQEAVKFASGYIAEFLPAQVLATDIKLPQEASQLAVRRPGSQDHEHLGSFDILLR